MDTFMITMCVWASIATIVAGWTIARVSAHRTQRAIEQARYLALEARSKGDV